jgi:catechol 2,3-dioxygenase-like lactoylglutathione lyase family enzyme
MIEGMNHFTVLTDDVERSVDFYVRLLGLAPGPRPDLGFPGAWLYSNGQAVLHIIGGRALPTQRAGVIDHMAFSARGLRAVADRLDAAAIQYELRRQRGSNTWQLFCHDPNGAKVELDFASSEER